MHLTTQKRIQEICYTSLPGLPLYQNTLIHLLKTRSLSHALKQSVLK